MQKSQIIPLYNLTPNEIQQEVNKIGYDVFPVQQHNGLFKVQVWFGDKKCYGLGRFEYKCWHNAVNITYRNLALKLKII